MLALAQNIILIELFLETDKNLREDDGEILRDLYLPAAKVIMKY